VDEIIRGAAVGIVAGLVVGIILAVVALLRPAKRCPGCGAELPKMRLPRSGRQWLLGGWACPRCGCEVNRKGEKITR